MLSLIISKTATIAKTRVSAITVIAAWMIVTTKQMAFITITSLRSIRVNHLIVVATLSNPADLLHADHLLAMILLAFRGLFPTLATAARRVASAIDTFSRWRECHRQSSSLLVVA